MNKVTAILPCLKDDMGKAVYSVLNQNFQDVEILVVSNFQVKQCIDGAKYVLMPGVKTISGLLNSCIRHIQTDLLCFVHPDELVLFDSIRNRYRLFENNPSLVGCWGQGICTDIDFGVKSDLNDQINNSMDSDIAIATAPLGLRNDNRRNRTYQGIKSLLSGEIKPTISSLMLRTELLEDYRFDENLKINYCTDFVLKLISKCGNDVCFVREPLYISRIEEIQVKEMNNGYFSRYIKEKVGLLDEFFDTEIIADIDTKAGIYKSNYYDFLSVLAEYYPHNYWLRVYLLASYVKKSSQLSNRILDFWYLSLLLNSLIALRSISEAGKGELFNKVYS